MLKVAILGGSGYTGAELLRILASHPYTEITAVTSEKSAGKKITDLFPHLHKYSNLAYEAVDKERLLQRADLFFLALPHGASQEAVDFFFRNGKQVIDLSADYRLSEPDVYAEWYKTPHNYQKTLGKAVYGLPELYRDKIKASRLIANPGCYPTSAILGLSPAVKENIVDAETIIVDSKSGTSGAGRKAETAFLFCEVNEGFKAYGVAVHRHTPEIEQEASKIAGKKIFINFTPHLVPMDRGILSTIYLRIKKDIDTKDVLSIYNNYYSKEPFVNILNDGLLPNVKDVRGSNYCHIGLKVNKRTNTLIIVAAIDNLVKGASGQAVQNMNIMAGFEETTGLTMPALFP
ncbi:MAG: N-acetyl-gamma-glutamyl-phosphate reductase [Nitrospirae bacterium]|nr:N-acetyl-gamma-glutamyl-phosphate reductase [Nitrospirota bacterium]